MDRLQLSLSEMEKLASAMVHPSEYEKVQVSKHLGSGQEDHTLWNG
jgi:hypothetical protein